MSAKTTSVAVTTALLLLTGAVIIEGIFILWMQEEINYIKTTINRLQTATVTSEGTSPISKQSNIQPKTSESGELILNIRSKRHPKMKKTQIFIEFIY